MTKLGSKIGQAVVWWIGGGGVLIILCQQISQLDLKPSLLPQAGCQILPATQNTSRTINTPLNLYQKYTKLQRVYLCYLYLKVEVCIAGLVFWVPNFCRENPGNFPYQAFRNILFPVPTQYHPFNTGHFPSRLSPENKPEFPNLKFCISFPEIPVILYCSETRPGKKFLVWH